MTVKILGTDYEILIKNENEDAYLKQCDGYCDKTSKKIVLTDKPEDNELEIFDVYARKIIRHEVLHAFLFESGLAENIRYEGNIGRQDEQMIDWFAIQFPKILKAYQELGIAE